MFRLDVGWLQVIHVMKLREVNILISYLLLKLDLLSIDYCLVANMAIHCLIYICSLYNVNSVWLINVINCLCIPKYKLTSHWMLSPIFIYIYFMFAVDSVDSAWEPPNRPYFPVGQEGIDSHDKKTSISMLPLSFHGPALRGFFRGDNPMQSPPGMRER